MWTNSATHRGQNHCNQYYGERRDGGGGGGGGRGGADCGSSGGGASAAANYGSNASAEAVEDEQNIVKHLTNTNTKPNEENDVRLHPKTCVDSKSKFWIEIKIRKGMEEENIGSKEKKENNTAWTKKREREKKKREGKEEEEG